VQDGRRTIDEAVAPVEHWLQTAAEKRTLGADELAREIAALGGVIRHQVETLVSKLNTERTKSSKAWTERTKQTRLAFNAGVAQVALHLPKRFEDFVKKVSDEKRWNTLAAIIKRAGKFDDGAHDRVFLEEMMMCVFAPTLTPLSQRYLATLKYVTATTLEKTGQVARERIGDLLKDLETQSGSRFGKELNHRLEVKCDRAVDQLKAKLDALVDCANRTADRAYQNVGKRLVESWAEPLRDDGGKGFRQRALNGLRDTFASRVAEIPDMVVKELGPSLDRISQEANEIGVQLFDDLAKEARAFIENELRAVQASMESAKSGTREKLAQEAQELEALLTRVRSARARIEKESVRRVTVASLPVALSAAPGTNLRDPGAEIFDKL